MWEGDENEKHKTKKGQEEEKLTSIATLNSCSTYSFIICQLSYKIKNGCTKIRRWTRSRMTFIMVRKQLNNIILVDEGSYIAITYAIFQISCYLDIKWITQINRSKECAVSSPAYLRDIGPMCLWYWLFFDVRIGQGQKFWCGCRFHPSHILPIRLNLGSVEDTDVHALYIQVPTPWMQTQLIDILFVYSCRFCPSPGISHKSCHMLSYQLTIVQCRNDIIHSIEVTKKKINDAWI